MTQNLRDTSPCDCNQNQYELDIVESLIEWLGAVTGILWIGATPNGSVPSIEDFKPETTQYGTIRVDTMDIAKSGRTSDSHRMNNDSDECVAVSRRVVFGITLTVYNYAKMPRSACREIKTSGDVLLRIFDAYYDIPRLKKCLTSYCIVIDNYNSIVNFETPVGNSYERGSSVFINFEVLRTTSYAKDLIKITN